MPVAIAPMAIHGLAHPDAELATARAAAAAGVPFTLSTMASRSIEDVAAAAPDGIRWFQLYVQREPSRSRSLVERAAAAGYGGDRLTVDLPVLGYRDRDRRSGFELSTLGNFVDRLPTHRPIGPKADELTDADHLSAQPDLGRPRRDPELVAAADRPQGDPHRRGRAARRRARGRRHRRQQPRRTATRPRPGDRVDALPEIAAAVAGRVELWVDGGVRRGLDIAVALALGARGVLLGRPAFGRWPSAARRASSMGCGCCARSSSSTLALLGRRHRRTSDPITLSDPPTPAARRTRGALALRPPTAT